MSLILLLTALVFAVPIRAAGQSSAPTIHFLEDAVPDEPQGLDAPDVSRLRKLAEEGNPKAQYHLGLIFWQGRDVERDVFQAIDWLRKSADQGNLEAQYNLGRIFFQGNAVEDALEWYRKAALRGHAGAQNSLGRMLVIGSGVKQDVVEAYAWWLLASKRGSSIAEQNLVKLHETMTAGQMVEAQRRAESIQSRIRPD